jgi:uncharacterized protein (DUF1330 family)
MHIPLPPNRRIIRKDPMPAFVVFIREKTSNEAEMEIYGKLALPTLVGRPAKPLAFYGTLEVLEGPEFEGAVILEFPSVGEAKTWYESSEYQAAAEHRKAASSFRVFILEGKNV